MCDCSDMKKNICEATTFGMLKLALTKSRRKELIKDTGIVYISGYLYDYMTKMYPMDYQENTKKIMDMWGKIIIQLFGLSASDMIMGKKIKIKKIIEDTLALGVSEYGLKMI